MADGRAEVHLHAVLETGEAALVTDDRFRPYFFVRAADRDSLHRVAPGVRASESPLQTFAGEPVLRIEVDLPGDVSAVGVRGAITVRATSGDVSAHEIGGVARIETSSGDVEALDVAGGARISTSTGDVVARVGGDSLVVETASGEIDARALGAPTVTSLRSSSGDIELKMKPNVGGRIEVQTASGGMHVRNPMQVESMDRNRLTGKLGGSGVVLLRTSSGDITVDPSEYQE